MRGDEVTYIEIEDSEGVSYRWAMPDTEDVDAILAAIEQIAGAPDTVKI